MAGIAEGSGSHLCRLAKPYCDLVGEDGAYATLQRWIHANPDGGQTSAMVGTVGSGVLERNHGNHGAAVGAGPRNR